jgi:hypothetical protein
LHSQNEMAVDPAVPMRLEVSISPSNSALVKCGAAESKR